MDIECDAYHKSNIIIKDNDKCMYQVACALVLLSSKHNGNIAKKPKEYSTFLIIYTSL